MKIALDQNEGGDLWDEAPAEEMPKEFATTEWSDSVLELKKWAEIDEKIKQVILGIKKIIKLKPNTQTYHFIDVAKRLHKQSNVRNKESILVLIGELAERLRKSFKQEAK